MTLPSTRQTGGKESRVLDVGPRVLWLTENFFPSTGGMAQSCDRIVHGLRQAGTVIDLVHFVPAWRLADASVGEASGLGESAERLCGRDIRWVLDDDVPHAMNQLFAWLEGSHRQAGYTHVVAFGGRYPMVAAPVFAAWLGADLITLLRGNDFDAGIFSPRHRSALLDALRASRHIGAVTTEKVEKVRALLPSADVVHTPNGIDLTDWMPLPSFGEFAAAWRAEHGLRQRLVLGCFGHLKRKKGIGFLIDGILASGCADKVHLHLVGALEPEVTERLPDGRDSSLSVTRCDFVSRSQMPGEYAKCDCLVIPSFYDGMPNVLLEGGGLGLPVIASDTGGMRDVLAGGEYGWLFRTGDRAACATAIHDACSATPEQRVAMGSALRRHIEREYSVRRETSCFLDLLQRNPVTTQS
jgi:glycogen(starch) synthase